MDTQEKARRSKNEYQRRWRSANPDKVRASNKRYWERRAEREAQETQRKELEGKL